MATESIPCGVSPRGRRTVAAALRRFITAIEPWYMWGTVSVERLQELRLDGDRIESGGEGDVRYFEIQWLGVHLQVQFGRTPKAVRS